MDANLGNRVKGKKKRGGIKEKEKGREEGMTSENREE